MVCVCVFVCVEGSQKIRSDIKKVNVVSWSQKLILGLAIGKTIGKVGL